MKAKKNIALGGVFVFFFTLFNAPFLHLPSGKLGEIPTLFIYILVVWVALILVMMLVNSEKKAD